MKYIIEHMEPKLYRWCIIEYKHISEIVGKRDLVFTNINKSDVKKLIPYGKVCSKKASEIDLGNCLILDPAVDKELSTADCKKFDTLLFGGILGDYPRKGRTRKLSSEIRCEKRNLGKKQFSTDNAVLVSHMIANGKKLNEIKFKDGIEIPLDSGESIMFPFRYVIVDGKPFISEELVAYLKKRGGF